MRRNRSSKSLILALLSGILLLGAASASTTSAPAVDMMNDDEVATAVDNALIVDDGVSAERIDVTAIDGIVTLQGSVDNLLAKERAADLAARIKGVRSIVNRIEVKPLPRLDAEIRSDVIAALVSDPATDSWEIDASVDAGVVHLTGAVDSWAEKELCTTVAKGVRGVRDVINDVAYTTDFDRLDSEIQAEIEARLDNDVWVDTQLIAVAVKDGDVTLSGAVGSLVEKDRARSRAWVAGVEDVDVSSLEVKWWAADSTQRQSAYERPDDDAIAQAVKDAMLYDPRVYSYAPTVEVDAGGVTLRGTVHDYQARRAAEEAARNTFGVWRVRNLLKVRPETTISDDAIYEAVEDSLERSPLVDEDGITLTVFDGEVSLYGEASSFFERSIAADIAGHAKGVVDVDNHIDVTSYWTSLNDMEIRKDVQDELWWSPFVDADEVSVEVTDGVATLRGTVDSLRERRAAVDNAFDGGAIAVRDRLTVAGDSEAWSEYHRYPPAVIF